ncbi:MAG: sugar phosphate isomerase/epimerase [Treponema sp.]|jgi:sugar phosphate isomerase/epimerase|nr:sugar phosphate isomerase/epimerase [Treponema sp.]
MHIGVSSYCFQRLLEGSGFSLFDAIKEAKKAGFDAIEFTDFAVPSGKTQVAFAAELRAACQSEGLSIPCYAVSADFINGSGGDMAAETARLKAKLDVAVALGVMAMRHDITWKPSRGMSYQEVVVRVAPAVRELSEYAAQANIRTMSENHGYFMQDSVRMAALVSAVRHPNYGLLVDMGNFLCADETSVTALSSVLPYAFHIHAKDFLWKSGAEPCPDDSWFPTRAGNWLRGTVLGHGVVSVGQCLRLVKNAGYDDTVSLEFEGPEEPLFAIRKGAEFLAKYLVP